MTRFSLVVLACFLAVDPWGWDQFGPLRWAAVSTLGFAAVAISLGSGDERAHPLPRWAVLGWVTVIVGMTLSTLLSGDRWYALTGTPERHLGLATWLLFAGLFATASLYPNTTTGSIFRSTSTATIVLGIWAILEATDVTFFTDIFDLDFAGDRVGGPFGQPAFLGAAMTLAVPIAVGLSVDRSASSTWRSIGLAAAAVGALALVLAQSRAAWVGVFVAGACVVIRRERWLLGAVGLALLSGLLVTTSIGDRAATLLDVDTGVVAGRSDEWQVGARALFDTPTFGLTGHGPEGYRTVFGRHVDEEYVITHGRDVITDRAHSGLLDTALGGGLIAGAGMSLLQAGLVATALQRLRADDPFDVALSAAVLGYLVQQLFLFPLAELDPVLWVLAGLLVARRPQRTTARARLFRNVSGTKRTAMFAAGFLAAASAVAGLSDVAADHAVKGVVAAQQDQDEAAALAHADTALSRRPDSIRYDFIASRAASRSGTVDGFTIALDRLEHGLTISPNDPALLTERAVILLEVARRYPAQAALDEALSALDDLDSTDPNNPTTELSHGIALALAGRTDDAITEMEHAALLAPDTIEPYLNLAIVHFETGNLEAGGDALDEVDRLAPANARAQDLRREFLSE